MGTDQGKTSNVNALAFLAALRGEGIPAVGTTTFRPPYTPVTFGAIAGRDVGALADPERVTAVHGWHVARGAVFEDVGQWKRPRYFPRPGEDMDRAVARECRAVRGAAGLLDAGTLGKIEVQGPDASAFVSLLYTGPLAKLQPGRCRYALLCREDGMVLDDGIAARIDQGRYFLTTSTGNAARVLDFLEDYRQTEFPQLKVWLTSVTEHWSVAQVAGPRAREILERVVAPGTDLSAAAMPFMSFADAVVAGVPSRFSASPSRASCPSRSTRRRTPAARSGTRSSPRASRSAWSPSAPRRCTCSARRRATSSSARRRRDGDAARPGPGLGGVEAESRLRR
jgi:sarcosine oxidase subunit alpha